MYLEWVQGEFADNAFTVEGRYVHKRADAAGGALPPVPPADEKKPDGGAAAAESDGGGESADEGQRPYVARSVWLTSERIGLTAKIDIVEGDAGGTVVPIEYKRGKAPDVDGGAYLPERAQICAQALLLREHGYRCDEGAIYFAASRKRVPVALPLLKRSGPTEAYLQPIWAVTMLGCESAAARRPTAAIRRTLVRLRVPRQRASLALCTSDS
jgi:hypothetical protein